MTFHDDEKGLPSASFERARSIVTARQHAQELTQALERKTEDLERSLALLRATLESTTDAIVVTDDAQRVTDWNQNFVRMWRLTEDVLQTRSQRRFFEVAADQCADPKGFLRRFEQIATEAPAESFDTVELLDGRSIERFSRLQYLDGRTVGRVWSFRDVTGRKHAGEEHAYLAAIVASSSDAIISKTLQGIITSWNAAAERMFGYTAQEAVGQSITLIIPADRIHEEEMILARLRRGERIERMETVRRRKDGQLLHVSLTVSPVLDQAGQIVGASKIARDVTEREQLLASEQAARARAEEASRLKDDFLATVSHELRTPLNAVLGWAQILRAIEHEDPKVRHAAEVIERNARSQAQVIEDLLDVSRIITGKLRLDVHPVFPAGPIESALEAVKPMAEARDVRLHSILDPSAGPVSGDSGRLQQIAWNLLSNAIKFTPRGGRVEVRLERVESQVQIVVSDSGEGISPEFLPYVFDRFRQADASSARRTGGLGLGLAIVRHLVELHGGTVRADSAGKGKGASFTIRLPLRPLQAKNGAESPLGLLGERRVAFDAAPALHGTRVLLVDDEADTRDLLREVLERSGAVVREASSAGPVLGMIQQWRPDVIVSDIGLPGEDGYTLMRRIRDWEKSEGIWTPAVALTAYARSEDRMRALLAGYQVHVAKPIEPMEFALVVAGVVQHAPPA